MIANHEFYKEIEMKRCIACGAPLGDSAAYAG